MCQDRAVAPSLDIASNILLGRERPLLGPLGWVPRMLDKRYTRPEATRTVTCAARSEFEHALTKEAPSDGPQGEGE